MKIFIDEQAWLALVDDNQKYGLQFRNEFEDFLKGPNNFYTTNIIIGNVVSQIKRNLGAPNALKFYNIIEEAWLANHLHVLWIGRRTMKVAIKLFKKFTEADVNLFDCANIVLMNIRNIRFILTLNKIYSDMGFKVVPEKLD